MEIFNVYYTGIGAGIIIGFSAYFLGYGVGAFLQFLRVGTD